MFKFFIILEQRNTFVFPAAPFDNYGDILYELTFQAFMYCEGDEKCAESNDVIELGVYSLSKDSSVSKLTKGVKYSDFSESKAWTTFSLQLVGIDNVYSVSRALDQLSISSILS